MANEPQIVIYEASEPAVIENDKRLPFEAYSAEMSEGAFGQVQKVTISKQHFVTEAGVMASNVSHSADVSFCSSMTSCRPPLLP